VARFTLIGKGLYYAKSRVYGGPHGTAGGSALTTDFTTLAEDLASHGFIVVGFDAPYRSFVVVLPDGRVVARSPAANVEDASGNLADPVIGKLLAMWTSDTAFAVDQLQRLNHDPSATSLAGEYLESRISGP
jgi:hypothetical protein